MESPHKGAPIRSFNGAAAFAADQHRWRLDLHTVRTFGFNGAAAFAADQQLVRRIFQSQIDASMELRHSPQINMAGHPRTRTIRLRFNGAAAFAADQRSGRRLR